MRYGHEYRHRHGRHRSSTALRRHAPQGAARSVNNRPRSASCPVPRQRRYGSAAPLPYGLECSAHSGRTKTAAQSRHQPSRTRYGPARFQEECCRPAHRHRLISAWRAGASQAPARRPPPLRPPASPEHRPRSTRPLSWPACRPAAPSCRTGSRQAASARQC